MAKPLNRKRKNAPKRVLRLPDLDLAKRTVLNSLGSPDSTRAYAHAIDDFIAWDCSEPRLAFGKHVVLRFPIGLKRLWTNGPGPRPSRTGGCSDGASSPKGNGPITRTASLRNGCNVKGFWSQSRSPDKPCRLPREIIHFTR